MNIHQFDKVAESEFAALTEDLEKICIPLLNANNRRGFPKHRGCVFGMTKPRFKSGGPRLSANSVKYPHIYDEICRIGNLVCPEGFLFKSIQLNKNVTCPPHKDSKNRSDSVIVSFGNYTGGNLVIENKEYDARHQPLMFNGAELEHWNTPDLEGTKYSLVFFTGDYR
jgi:hypothetical protein